MFVRTYMDYVFRILIYFKYYEIDLMYMHINNINLNLNKHERFIFLLFMDEEYFCLHRVGLEGVAILATSNYDLILIKP